MNQSICQSIEHSVDHQQQQKLTHYTRLEQDYCNKFDLSRCFRELRSRLYHISMFLTVVSAAHSYNHSYDDDGDDETTRNDARVLTMESKLFGERL